MSANLPDPLMIVILRKQEPDTTIARIEATAPGRVHVSRIPESDELTPEQEQALSEGHVAFVGAACPRDLLARMPSLLWVHANFAGITELSDRDFWGTDVIMTSARGHTDIDALAEMTLTGGLTVAKDLHTAARGNFSRTTGRENVKPLLVNGKTIGIVGLGGIGSTLATLAKGLRMRVLATRRSAERRETNVGDVDVLYPAADLMEMAQECDFLAICAPGTPDTYHMIDASVFSALLDNAVVMNIARGELIDEEAMLDALDTGRLRGAYLDVYEAERDREPSERLSSHPRVLRTPHVGSSSDIREVKRLEVFMGNLRHFLDDELMEGVVDWERGY
jgi:phosphoglycerate dehydrogenase-like enzyme